MIARGSLLVSKSSIDDIIPYISIDIPKNNRKTALPKIPTNSRLERMITLFSRKDRIKTSFKLSENLEETISPGPVNEQAKVSYELFIPVAGLDRYDGVEIKYSSKKNQESIEIDLAEKEEEAALKIEKPLKEKAEYSILFTYDKARQGYKVKYEAEYKEKLEQARQDFTNRLDKSLEILPKSLMGGILGFTYLGSGKMTRRDDLFGDMALMVDVHEAIHTTDEYETRVLTSWMLKREKPKYKR